MGRPGGGAEGGPGARPRPRCLRRGAGGGAAAVHPPDGGRAGGGAGVGRTPRGVGARPPRCSGFPSWRLSSGAGGRRRGEDTRPAASSAAAERCPAAPRCALPLSAGDGVAVVAGHSGLGTLPAAERRLDRECGGGLGGLQPFGLALHGSTHFWEALPKCPQPAVAGAAWKGACFNFAAAVGFAH